MKKILLLIIWFLNFNIFISKSIKSKFKKYSSSYKETETFDDLFSDATIPLKNTDETQMNSNWSNLSQSNNISKNKIILLFLSILFLIGGILLFRLEKKKKYIYNKNFFEINNKLLTSDLLINNPYLKIKDHNTSIIEVDLIKNFQFNDVNNNQLENVVKLLYKKMYSCQKTDDLDQAQINVILRDKYPNNFNGFQFRYDETKNSNDHNTIRIWILKQNNQNVFTELLKIGYEFSDKSFFLKYFFENNKNITYYYNNKSLFQIDLNENQNRKFILKKQNDDNEWKLVDKDGNYIKDEHEKPINDNIVLNKESLKLTYDFLKKTSGIISKNPIFINNNAITKVKINLHEKNIKYLQKKSIQGLNIEKNLLILPLIDDVQFDNFNSEQSIKLLSFIQYLYKMISDCKNEDDFLRVLNNNIIYIDDSSNIGIIKNKKEYQSFYINAFFNKNQIEINILTKKTDIEYNQLLNISYFFDPQKYSIEYFLQNNNSIQIFYNKKNILAIKFISNSVDEFFLYKNENDDQWYIKDQGILQKNIILQTVRTYQCLQILSGINI